MADKNPLVMNGGQQEVLQSTDKLPITALATGTPDGTKFVADDGTLKTPSGSAAVNNPLMVQIFS